MQRLAEDHTHAQQIAEALAAKSFTGAMLPVETNIIIFEVTGDYTAPALAAKAWRRSETNEKCNGDSPMAGAGDTSGPGRGQGDGS